MLDLSPSRGIVYWLNRKPPTDPQPNIVSQVSRNVFLASKGSQRHHLFPVRHHHLPPNLNPNPAGNPCARSSTSGLPRPLARRPSLFLLHLQTVIKFSRPTFSAEGNCDIPVSSDLWFVFLFRFCLMLTDSCVSSLSIIMVENFFYRSIIYLSFSFCSLILSSYP